jgi:hypothetical protein
MKPQELLPPPEIRDDYPNEERKDSMNELEASKMVEIKSSVAQAGSGIMSASAINDAQSQLHTVSDNVVAAFGVSTASDDDDDSTALDLPTIAEDVDLIEKEWVKKAKDIVSATLGDPYMQNKQISKMKAEYVKKRYDREIKMGDE